MPERSVSEAKAILMRVVFTVPAALATVACIANLRRPDIASATERWAGLDEGWHVLAEAEAVVRTGSLADFLASAVLIVSLWVIGMQIISMQRIAESSGAISQADEHSSKARRSFLRNPSYLLYPACLAVFGVMIWLLFLHRRHFLSLRDKASSLDLGSDIREALKTLAETRPLVGLGAIMICMLGLMVCVLAVQLKVRLLRSAPPRSACGDRGQVVNDE